MKQPLPNAVTRDAMVLFDLIIRFAGLLDICSSEVMNLAADWLTVERNAEQGKSERYFLSAAIAVLHTEAKKDLNGEIKDDSTQRHIQPDSHRHR